MQSVSLSAVKSRLARGRARLERYYRRHYANERVAAAGAVAENGG
jgi:DNA-directed RNA polymerase specialized sigma24 family protein